MQDFYHQPNILDACVLPHSCLVFSGASGVRGILLGALHGFQARPEILRPSRGFLVRLVASAV